MLNNSISYDSNNLVRLFWRQWNAISFTTASDKPPLTDPKTGITITDTVGQIRLFEEAFNSKFKVRNPASFELHNIRCAELVGFRTRPPPATLTPHALAQAKASTFAIRQCYQKNDSQQLESISQTNFYKSNLEFYH